MYRLPTRTCLPVISTVNLETIVIGPDDRAGHGNHTLLQRDGHTAIDQQTRAIHISRKITGQKQRGTREVFRPAETAEGYPAFLVGALDGVGQVLFVDVCLYGTCAVSAALLSGVSHFNGLAMRPTAVLTPLGRHPPDSS